MQNILTLLIVLIWLLKSTTVFSESIKGKLTFRYLILDLQVMDERKYDDSRDKTIIGLPISQEIFKTYTDCENALIQKYSGTSWEIEKTKNPQEIGRVRLHQYRPSYEYNEKGELVVVNRIYNVRFCTNLILPANYSQKVFDN